MTVVVRMVKSVCMMCINRGVPPTDSRAWNVHYKDEEWWDQGFVSCRWAGEPCSREMDLPPECPYVLEHALEVGRGSGEDG